MKYLFILLISCVLQNILIAQINLPSIKTDLCDDGGFEVKDFSNWGWTMVQYQKALSASNLIFKNTVTGIGNPFDFSFTNNFSTNVNTLTCWEIVSTGSDPVYSNLSRTHSGNKALRLGRIELDSGILANNGAEAIQKTISIDSSNTSLSFWYALVLEDPTGDSGHSDDRSPAFGVRIYVNTTNVSYIPISPIIPGFSTDPLSPYTTTTSHPFWTDSIITERGIFTNFGQNKLPPQATRIRDWTCGSVDLSEYIGQKITIEFIVNDCSQRGHFGYAYIDDICMGCENSDMGDASIDGISNGCGPVSYVNGTYTLPQKSSNTGTLNSITAILYQNGVPTAYSSLLPNGSINNSSQTFNFPMSIFNNIPSGSFDIVLEASFTFSGLTYVTTSNVHGFIIGINNDWKSECPIPLPKCCHNNFAVVSPVISPISYPYNAGTYSIENFNVTIPNNIPLTEIRVNVESFEIQSAFSDCQKCENKPIALGSIFGISTIGSGINTLHLTIQDYGTGNNININNNELIWSNTNGVSLNSNDKIGIVYLLPSSNKIPCCALKAKICIRISWRDIDCNYCEGFTCSIIDLKNSDDNVNGSSLPSVHQLYLNTRGIYNSGKANGF